MRSWRSRTPGSRMCSAEHRSAVCASGRRGDLGAGARPRDRAGLPDRPTLADGVVPPRRRSQRAGSARHRGALGAGRAPHPLGLLALLRSPAGAGPPVELEARLSGLSGAAAQPEAAAEEAGPGAAAAGPGGPADSEPDLGARLHGRHAVRPPAVSHAECARRRAPRGAGDRDRDLAPEPPRRATAGAVRTARAPGRRWGCYTPPTR